MAIILALRPLVIAASPNTASNHGSFETAQRIHIAHQMFAAQRNFDEKFYQVVDVATCQANPEKKVGKPLLTLLFFCWNTMALQKF